MARADRRTLLPLDEWFRIMGINPLHGNQINLPEIQNDFCGDIWFQHSWQAGAQISREDLAEAIAQAEHRIQEYVGYSLAPDWIVDERRPTIRPSRPELLNFGTSDVRWANQVVIGEAKKWIAGGRRVAELVETPDVNYSHDSETPPTDYKETARAVSIALPLETSPCEVKLFHPGKNGAPEWEIRPLRDVNIFEAGPVVITEVVFDTHLAVVEKLQEELVPKVVDGTDTGTEGSFLQTVDMYRVFNDPKDQAELLWEPFPSCGCAAGVTCHICEYAFQSGCLIARGDPDNTILAYHPATFVAESGAPPDVVPAHFDPTKLVIGRQPDLVRLFYYAGHQDKSLECATFTMDPYWANVVAHFAAALLRKIPCDCSKLDFEHWQQDLAFVGGVGEASIFQLAPNELSNPFGTRRGAVEAWRAVNSPGVQLLRTSVSV